MAKGDQSGINAGSAAATGQPPKQDQYSVMHALMNAFGGNFPGMNNSIAPTSPMGGRIGTEPVGRDPNSFSSLGALGSMSNPISSLAGTSSAGPAYGSNNSSFGMPRLGTMYGVASGAPSMAPTNPQDMLRRTMMNKGFYGQNAPTSV